MELVVVVGNFPVRCHGLDVAQLLEPWLLARGPHITVFSGLFLGLRTDPESSKVQLALLTTEGGDPYRVIVCQCLVADRDSELLLSHCRTVPAKINFLSRLQRRPKGSKGGKQSGSPKHATSTHLTILSRLRLSPEETIEDPHLRPIIAIWRPSRFP